MMQPLACVRPLFRREKGIVSFTGNDIIQLISGGFGQIEITRLNHRLCIGELVSQRSATFQKSEPVGVDSLQEKL